MGYGRTSGDYNRYGTGPTRRAVQLTAYVNEIGPLAHPVSGNGQHHRQMRPVLAHSDSMTHIEDIFTRQDHYQPSDPIDCNPFTADDALFDTQLLDCRVCPTANRAALLFEMRTAECFPKGNAAVLVVHGLQSFRWDGILTDRSLTAFSVQEYKPSVVAGTGVRLDLGFFPHGDLSVAGDRADFHLLEVPSIPQAPPNYSERNLGQVRDGLPWWDSSCTVLQSCTTSST